MSTNPRIFSGSSDGYDEFMGRYSRQLATPFLDFAGIREGQVLDVGAGTGALTQALLDRQCVVAAAEPSEDFVGRLRDRFPSVDVRRAVADELPWGDDVFDAVASQLVVAFLPDAPAAVREQRRVARGGGVVAANMWELDGIEAIAALNAVRSRLQPGRDNDRLERWRSEPELRALFVEAGLTDVETTTIDVAVEYDSVDDLWRPAIEAAGPGGAAVGQMPAQAVEAGRDVLADVLGHPDGPFTLHGRCVCVRGVA